MPGAVYHDYSLSSDIPYLVEYVCENCGEINSVIHVSKVISRYSDKGTWTNADVARRRSKAIDRLDDIRKIRIAKISEEAQNHDYRTIHLTCACKRCGKYPIWSFKEGKIISLLERVAVFSFFASIVCFFYGFLTNLDKTFSIQPFLPAIAISIPFLLFFVFRIVRDQIKSIRIKKMDKDFLPKLTLVSKE